MNIALIIGAVIWVVLSGLFIFAWIKTKSFPFQLADYELFEKVFRKHSGSRK